MTDWIVRRWARYGHERLYVARPGGPELGYYDTRSRQYHCDDPANIPLLQQAITNHHSDTRDASPDGQPDAPSADATSGIPAPVNPLDLPPLALSETALPTSPILTPAPSTTGPAPAAEWRDLSTTQPGAAAQERADVERRKQGTVRHLLSRLVGAKTDERAWRIGAAGERAVAAQLYKLGHQWRVLHAVPVGARGADIDHVVIGPGGVFTVNAKHHPHASIWVGGDTFMVNGQRVPYIRNSRHEARRASCLLAAQVGFPVATTGLIAVMGAANGFKVKAQPEDKAVAVVRRRRISRYLRSHPDTLTALEVDAIYEAARRSTTWLK